MRVHFIAIGGAAMHNLALALLQKGYDVSGSDDEIFEPSKSRLNKAGLLPSSFGWDAGRITKDIDAVILGMHAREDNPELLEAQSMGLAIYSYPEYLYEQSKNHKRVVIGGSHGKTSITAMILHILNKLGRKEDYMVGAQLQGYETMVQLSNDAEFIVLEGDEYLSSPIDRRPKFHHYHPHIALLSGIAWDHINVFPTFEDYIDQFRQFIQKVVEQDGVLIYCEEDTYLPQLVEEFGDNLRSIPYRTHPYQIEGGKYSLQHNEASIQIELIGKHNMQNLNGARLVLNEMGVTDEEFYQAIADFTGAARRLEKIYEEHDTVVYKDFAHSPSKLKATVDAVKEQFPERHLLAVMELHTFSSLNKQFLKEYRGSMDASDESIVFFKPEVLQHKKLEDIDESEVMSAFGKKDLKVMTNSQELERLIKGARQPGTNILLMSSGNFGGIEVDKLF